mmetsp:Transcript_28656/g.66458  ORF Transcript_28656/g.66458 Transcript_28656/m.66458 type:complete len:1743 (+) Transcript_28656:82-5310(+)
MMWLWVLAGMAHGAFATSAPAVEYSGEVKVGILHSLTGTMAISEQTVVNAELMAISEINAAGGVIGRRIVPVIEDGESDWPTFAQKAEKFTNPSSPDRVEAVFGCWTSASRKEVLPVFERNDHMLFYPVQYEGQECSKNIFYTGATPNQQIEPAVDWLLRYKSKKFFLVGSDYVFPRTANEIIRNQLATLGGETVGEMYLPLGEKSEQEVGAIIDEIMRQLPEGGVIFNTLNGDSNVKFFHMFYDAGLRADRHPIMSVSITETEIDVIGVQYLIGHYAAWNFFMVLKDAQACPGSFDPTQAIGFVNRYRAMYGNESLVNDPMEAAYIAVLLWAEAVELAGTFDIEIVRKTVIGMAVGAPEGEVTMTENHHITKFVRLGEVTPSGEFSIFYESTRAVFPEPWNSFVETTAGYACDWSDEQDESRGEFFKLDTVSVALVHDLSGPNAAQDTQFMESEIATIRQVNREGGVNGKTVVFTVHDTGGSEATAVSIVRSLAEQADRPVIIFGSEPSDAGYDAAMAAIDFGGDAPPLMVNPRFSIGGECSANVLHTGGSLKQRLQPALGVFIQRSLAARRDEAAFYIVGSLDDTSLDIIRGHIEQAGGVVKGVSRAVSVMEAQNVPTAILDAMPDGGTIINLMTDNSFTIALLASLDANSMGAGRFPVFFTNFAESDLEMIGAGIASHWVASPYFQAEESAQNTIFLDSIRQAYGREYAVSERTASAYLGVRYWVAAAALAGAFDSKALERIMWTQEILTVDGLLRLTASNYLPRSFKLGVANEQLSAFRIFQAQTLSALEPDPAWVYPEMGTCDFSRSLQLVCVIGQGLVGQSGAFTSNPDVAVGCDWCPQGTFSELLPRAGDLPTRSCQPCGLGMKQGIPGQEECVACEAGAYASAMGMTACERCGIGRFQASEGGSECDECQAPMTTRLFGASSPQDCGCPAGMYFDAPCTACGDGMECSDFNQSLPRQLAGWFIENNTGFAVWRCASEAECPVGLPGTCRENRDTEKPACALCRDGYKALSNGSCEECSIDASVMLLPLAILLGTVGLVVVHIAVNFPRAKTSAKSLSAGILGGLAVNAVLNFNIYQGTSEIWNQPLGDFFEIMQIFRLDLNAMNFSCLTGSNNPVLRYAGEIMVPILAFFAMILGSFLTKCCIPRKKMHLVQLARPAFINTYGGIVSVFFISVSILTFKPFKCVKHPSGIESLESNRNIRCWEDGDGHNAMVMLALLAVLIYPVSFLAMTGYLTLAYHRCLQKYGSGFLEQTRFLFNRFHPQNYYFGFWFNVRSMMLALTPVVFSASFGMKMFSILGIFTLWFYAQMTKNPWRFPICDFFDSVLSPIQIVTVLCFALLAPAVSDENSVNPRNLGITVICCCMTSVGILIIAGVVKLIERLRGRRYWTFFLSHHKVACGLFARQVKLMIEEVVPSANIFLDVDNLENLDSLVFTVSSNTENMIVLLSSETLKRFWCAVEVAISYLNKVNLVLMDTEHGATKLAKTEILEVIPELWNDKEWSEFMECGVQLKDIDSSYQFLLAMRPRELLMAAEQSLQNRGINELLENCESLPRHLRSMTMMEVDRTCAIVFDTESVQQYCATRVLQLLLDRRGWTVEVLFGDIMPNFKIGWIFITMLSSGFFSNPVSAGLLTVASKTGIVLVPVMNQAAYVRPDAAFMAQVLKGTAFTDEKDMEVLKRVAPGCAPFDMHDAFSNIAKKIALKFTPEGHVDMMQLELQRIIARTTADPEVAWMADV